MIKWCAYCQHFTSIVPPYDDFMISHGICRPCMANMPNYTEADQKRARELRTLLQSLQERALAGLPIDPHLHLHPGRSLGVSSLDLLICLFQPLLEEVGKLWEQGLMSVATERRFSELALNMLDHARADPRSGGEPDGPEILMANAQGNRHTLGLQMSEPLLASWGIPALVLPDGVPAKDLADLAAKLKPKALGLSLALPEHLDYALEVHRLLEGREEGVPPIILGGPLVIRELDLEGAQTFLHCRKITDLPALLGIEVHHHSGPR